MTEQDLFINKVKDGAIQGWHECKILPSVTIAQACLESGWGKSELTKKANNLFGIKAKEDWKGESVTIKTAEYDKNNNKFYIEAPFRKYKSWQESIVDHSKFFASTAWRKENYKKIFGETDYKKAAQALQEAGYATSQTYASQLVGLIEMYKLYKYDDIIQEGNAMIQFKYKPITNAKQMGMKRNKSNIKFIVIHYTGNPGEGANANAHYKYLQSATRYGSAHYFVDDHEIIQVIGDSTTAWAVGDNQGYGRALNGCTNENSISVEMCINSDGNFDKTYFNTVELFKELKRLYPSAKICRHYDVSRKKCPMFLVDNAKFQKFLEDVAKPRRIILDLSKDSVSVDVGADNVKKSEPKASKKKIVIYKSEGDKATAELFAFKFGCEMIRDDGTINTAKYGGKDKWDIIYIGEGNDRFDSLLKAIKRYI